MPLDEVTARQRALELANSHIGATPISPTEVVARAAAYHTFLTGAKATVTNPLANNKPDKAAAAASGTPAQSSGTAKGAAAGKPATTGTKPAAGGKPAAGKPAAAAMVAAAAGNVKGPGGTYTKDQVRDKLREIATTDGLGRDRVYEILKEDGEGVESLSALKPEHFDAVYEGCTNALGGGEGGDKSGAVSDDLGLDD